MIVLQAGIATDRAGRYVTQFCKHAAAMGSPRAHRFRLHGGARPDHGQVRVTAEWGDATGTVEFDPWGRAELEAAPDSLRIRIHAVDDAAATRIQTIIGDDLGRFGRGKLTVTWRPVETETADAGDQA